MALLRSVGIKRVFYTTENGFSEEVLDYRGKDITVLLKDFFRKSNGFASPYHIEELSVAVGK